MTIISLKKITVIKAVILVSYIAKPSNSARISIPINNSNYIKIGIENLLSYTSIEEAASKGYITHSKTSKTVGDTTDTIENYELIKNQKSNLCNWFCTERENSTDDIAAFCVIFDLIESKLL
ncbi:MAG: hypothetical protein WC665_10780 [Sulfurimonas sp.]